MLSQVGEFGILEIGHEDAGAGIERVDHHLAVGRPGDLDAAVLEIGGDRRHGPFAFADGARLGQEIGQRALVEELLALGPALSAARRRRSSKLRCSPATKATASGVRTRS